jgi:hypothetical protein
VWLVAIRPSDSVALPCDRRSVVGVGSKGGLAGCAHELPRRHRRLGGRSWAARRAVFGRFPAAALPMLGFLSRSKVRPSTSTQVLPGERCCSRRIVGGQVRRDRFDGHLRHRAARLQHAGSVAVAALHPSAGQLTRSCLWICSGATADEVVLLMDSGN